MPKVAYDFVLLEIHYLQQKLLVQIWAVVLIRTGKGDCHWLPPINTYLDVYREQTKCTSPVYSLFLNQNILFFCYLITLNCQTIPTLQLFLRNTRTHYTGTERHFASLLTNSSLVDFLYKKKMKPLLI